MPGVAGGVLGVAVTLALGVAVTLALSVVVLVLGAAAVLVLGTTVALALGAPLLEPLGVTLFPALADTDGDGDAVTELAEVLAVDDEPEFVSAGTAMSTPMTKKTAAMMTLGNCTASS